MLPDHHRAPPAAESGPKRWLLGGQQYAHPALRWASWPTFRLALLLLVIYVNFGGAPHHVLRTLGLFLLCVSLAAEVVNLRYGTGIEGQWRRLTMRPPDALLWLGESTRQQRAGP